MLPEAARTVVDDDRLNNFASAAAEALSNVQESEVMWCDIDDRDGFKLKVQTLGNLSGDSAPLCLDLMSLIDRLAEVSEDAMILQLTHRWQAAAKKRYNEITDMQLKLTNTSGLKKAIPAGNWNGT